MEEEEDSSSGDGGEEALEAEQEYMTHESRARGRSGGGGRWRSAMSS